MLLRTDTEFCIRVGNWRTRLLVAVRSGASSKFNCAKDACILWPLHYFSQLMAPSISGSNTTGFLSLDVYRSGRTETKYSAVHFTHHWKKNSSSGCMKQEKENERRHSWRRWIFQIVNIIFCLLSDFNVLFDRRNILQQVSCLTFRSCCILSA